MKFSMLIVTLVSIFTWNAFASEALIGEAKIFFPELQTLQLRQPSSAHQAGPLAQAIHQPFQSIQCKFEGNRQPSSLTNSPWNVIASGANFEKRTITLFNSNSNEVLLMSCYKLSPEAPRKTTPVSDAQVIELLKASQVRFI